MIKKFNLNMWISTSQDGIHWEYRPNREDILKKINELIDVVNGFEPKHGRWLKTGQSFVFPEKFRNYFCSECGFELDKNIRTGFRYCPNCGARMDLDEVENG